MYRIKFKKSKRGLWYLVIYCSGNRKVMFVSEEYSSIQAAERTASAFALGSARDYIGIDWIKRRRRGRKV